MKIERILLDIGGENVLAPGVEVLGMTAHSAFQHAAFLHEREFKQ